MDRPVVQTEIHDRIAAIPAAEWDALHDGSNPFVCHAFLRTLEATGCIGAGTGWMGHYITLRDPHGLLAAAPAYLKTHSYGEFVFDFGWSQAYQRLGLPYYPKLVIGIPFTPATGPRLLVRRGPDVEDSRSQLLGAIRAAVDSLRLSSAHLLFANDADIAAARAAGFLVRSDCQFLWRNAGWRSFDEYLASFTAEKRKKTRRERRRVLDAGVHLETRRGHELTPTELRQVYALLQRTFRQRGMEPYISAEFLSAIAGELRERMMLQLARRDGRLIAAAVFFVGAQCLFGRYWGAIEAVHSL
ncbi:MAG: GNAT family N-acetyltransferase, partial [Steroidobacteraceae bacterium]|nr:GNAT family N-acetyltransferase [Steroidobacteraceae bacterium]MDW8260642.1 peptidogalycan biosysnthesis protein [Gammaproteobacteria bacterium]